MLQHWIFYAHVVVTSHDACGACFIRTLCITDEMRRSFKFKYSAKCFGPQMGSELVPFSSLFRRLRVWATFGAQRHFLRIWARQTVAFCLSFPSLALLNSNHIALVCLKEWPIPVLCKILIILKNKKFRKPKQTQSVKILGVRGYESRLCFSKLAFSTVSFYPNIVCGFFRYFRNTITFVTIHI